MTTTEQRRILVGYANSFHDQAIALCDGDVVYAEAFERLLQSKRALGVLGLSAVEFGLLKSLGRLGVVPARHGELIVRSTWNWTERQLEGQRRLVKKGSQDKRLSLGDAQRLRHFAEQVALASIDQFFATQLASSLAKRHVSEDLQHLEVTFIPTDHHLCHAANAVYTSPFEECAVMVIDGAGEGHSASFYHFADNEFRPIYRNESIASSLGGLYARVTELCGWNSEAGDDWKVMGLAAYGRPRPEIYEFFASRTKRTDLRVELSFEPGSSAELEKIVGGFRTPDDPDVMRAADLAHNFQRYFSDVVSELAAAFGALGLSANLAYAGGCALNSSANGELLARTSFKRLHVPSAPADDGNALGAALYEKHQVRKEPRRLAVMSPYLGSDFDVGDVEKIVAFGGLKVERAADDDALCERVSRLLADGGVVGWMQGRAEFGPRALGNRSILADPRAPDMKKKINELVKFREWYRPVAPAILHEFGEEYFESYQESPYMERALRFRPAVRDRVPGVVHEDGTGRHQSVRSETNPLFARLLRTFHRHTGVPVLGNTSLNVMGKPIVHSCVDALSVFMSTGMHHLVIGPYVISR